MSFVIAAPELMTPATTDVAGIVSLLSEVNAAAAVLTTGVLAAAEDEVSTAIAAVFSAHGQPQRNARNAKPSISMLVHVTIGVVDGY